MPDSTKDYANYWLMVVSDPVHGALARADSDDERKVAWLAWAQGVYRDRSTYVRPDDVTKPATLPADDMECYAAAKKTGAKVAHNVKVSQDDRLLLREFNDWRRDILAQETVGMRRMETMIRAIWAFEMVGVTDSADNLRLHVFRVWGVDLPRPIDVNDRGGLQKIVTKANRRTDVCPSWLLDMGDPPVLFDPDDKEE